MNLQQLQYIVAVAQKAHFAKAAKSCFVTQPTLSMMVQKLEKELDVQIFDRSQKPVVPTEIGQQIINQAQAVLLASERIKELVEVHKNTLQGSVKLGVIPTLAPYLIPLFVRPFLKKYPEVSLKVKEYTTSDLIVALKNGSLDVGLLVTPLLDKEIKEMPLFYEAFLIYSSMPYKKEYLLPKDIDTNKLWLLEEGHCLRSQIMNLCELRKNNKVNFEYQAGSIDTLIRLVETYEGITIVPELACLYLDEKQKQKIKRFSKPEPVREVSLVIHKNFVKTRLTQCLFDEVMANVPEGVKKRKSFNRISL